MLGERDALGGEAREHEAAIGGHARRAGEAVRGLVEAVVPARVGHAQQRPAEVIGPAVIGASEGARGAPLGRAHHGAAVHAAVHEDGDVAVLPPHHDDGLGAEAPGDEVAGPGDLAVVPHEHPAAVEDALHLLGEDAGVGVERGVDPIVLDQRFVVDLLIGEGGVGLRHGGYATGAA
jgi:hypothetical protein